MWPFNADAMKHKVVHPKFSLHTDAALMDKTSTAPSNILLPRSAVPSNQSSLTGTSAATTPALQSRSMVCTSSSIALLPGLSVLTDVPIRSASLVQRPASSVSTSTDATSFDRIGNLSSVNSYSSTSGGIEPVASGMQSVGAIQPTFVDDDDLPSSTHATYTTLQPVALNPSFTNSQSFDVIQTPQSINQISLSVSSSGMYGTRVY